MTEKQCPLCYQESASLAQHIRTSHEFADLEKSGDRARVGGDSA